MSAFVFSFERPVSAADFRNLAQQTDWACDRSIEGIAASLARSYLVLGVWQEERLIGVARVISDGVYRARVDDVIVDVEFRRQGIGTEMMRQIIRRLRHVESIDLGCGSDLAGFYTRLGFWQGDWPHLHMKPSKEI